MDAVELVDRHFPGFEARTVECHLQIPYHQLLVQNLLLREPGRVDRLEAGQEALRLDQAVVNRLLREVVQLVVVALIAKDRSIDRARPERVLPLLVQQIVERFAPRLEVGGRSGEHRWKQQRKSNQAH